MHRGYLGFRVSQNERYHFGDPNNEDLYSIYLRGTEGFGAEALSAERLHGDNLALHGDPPRQPTRGGAVPATCLQQNDKVGVAWSLHAKQATV